MRKRKINITKIKTCPVCHKRFECYGYKKKNHAHTLSGKYKRPYNSKTCSSRCSKIYSRNWDYYKKIR